MAPKKLTTRQKAIAAGYRSGLEEKVATQYSQAGVPVAYEDDLIRYLVPARPARYTPDFVQPNGIIVETKGRFVAADRKKHLLIKDQHPDLDIRFVFSNPNSRISKVSLTTYAKWCELNGFAYAKAVVPTEWMKEPVNHKSIAALEAAGIPIK
jgi:hypothetical protein